MWWMKRVCPLAVSVTYLSPTPLNVSPPRFLSFSRCGYLQYTPYCMPPQLCVCTSTLRKSQPQLSRSCFATANEASQRKPQSSTTFVYLQKEKKNTCTEIQAAHFFLFIRRRSKELGRPEKPVELEADMPFSSRPAPPRLH